MLITKFDIQGLLLIDNFLSKDERGVFVKTFNKKEFEKYNLNTDFVECYYSISNANVIRGMHFQMPPHNHEKLVYVTNGKILDVILDLRISSKSFGKFEFINLTNDNKAIYIPSGCAHGFLSLEDNTIVNYQVTSMYDKDSDSGILWNSFGFSWPVINPIISQRDLSFEKFKNFKSSFQ